MISENDKAALQRAILLFCREKGRTLAEIRAASDVAPFVEKYGADAINRFVRSLAQSTLLFQSGRTNSAVYRSTAAAGKLLGG